MFVSDSAYDRFMGRFSRKLAPAFAGFAGVAEGMRVLDVGAGTGALTAELAERGMRVAAAEPSPQFVEALRTRVPGVDARVAGAEELPWEDGAFDAALSQLAVTFMRDAPTGIREMRRVVRPGGTVAVCMWDREEMELLGAINRTRVALGGAYEPGAYRTREELEGLLGPGAEARLLAVDADYVDFDDFWSALLGGSGPAGIWASALDDEQREAARAELFRQLRRPEGSFTLTGRAWAVRITRA